MNTKNRAWVSINTADNNKFIFFLFEFGKFELNIRDWTFPMFVIFRNCEFLKQVTDKMVKDYASKKYE